MVLLTGDTHGYLDIQKLTSNNRAWRDTLRDMTRDDFVIILGDFGLVWDNDGLERFWLKWLNDKPFTTLFIDGNHENYRMLAQYPVEEWHGGKVQRIRKNILHLMRGQVFDICGKKFFTMGGAQSHDMLWRVRNLNWWPEEMPRPAEYDEAWVNLAACDHSVDYILTHSLPSAIQSEWFEEDYFMPNALTDFLEVVYQKVAFHGWYSGHYHLDISLQNPKGKMRLLYQDIVRIIK